MLPEPTEVEVRLAPGDLDWSTCRGTGPGGQTRNKTESTVLLTHRPTGAAGPLRDVALAASQPHRRARAVARAAVGRARTIALHAERAQERRAQLGTGMRGDKRRTIRCQDGTVIDHVTGRRWELRAYLRGKW